MLKFVLWLIFAICLFSWLEQIDRHIKSIDRKLSARPVAISNQ